MREREKALFHAALVVVSVAELFTSKSRLRTLLIGACAGWHAYAVSYHLKSR